METLLKTIPKDLRVQGLKETLREAKANNVCEIYLAKDCDEDFIAKVQSLNIKTNMVQSRAVLGNKLGIDVPCGVIAILKNQKN